MADKLVLTQESVIRDPRDDTKAPARYPKGTQIEIVREWEPRPGAEPFEVGATWKRW
jgi:hypothetical protein